MGLFLPSLFFLFILLPTTVVFFFAWFVYKDTVFGKILGGMWGLFAAGLLTLIAINLWNQKVVLDRDDFTGQYIIDRTYCAGTQADWQYEHFRFEIRENDSIFFYVTEGERIIRTYKGTVRAVSGSFPSQRLAIRMVDPHHILSENPTIYRNNRGFRLVFYSPKFYHVCFKKGKWKPIGKGFWWEGNS